MATSRPASASRPTRGPNLRFRELRGRLSPGEFAAAVRRAAREIGENVSCDARYIGRVEAGEIRCPNYAYERVFLHMFPGRTLTDMGFEPRQAVRGRRRGSGPGPRSVPLPSDPHDTEESDVLRRAFMTGGSAALASLISLGTPTAAFASRSPALSAGRPGEREAAAVRQAVREIRVLDDRHGAEILYGPAGRALRSAYAMLDTGARRAAVSDSLHTGTGELAISVGWLAHDSRRPLEARSHYLEALATARMCGDSGLEAHAFCNLAFLARDGGTPREAVRAAQAGQQAARPLGSHRLMSLLTMREAGGWAALRDRSGFEEALGRAHLLFARGARPADPEWLSFFGEAELASLEAKGWELLGEPGRAAECSRRAVSLQTPHFARNVALYSTELAGHLISLGEPEGAAEAANRAADLLGQVRSARITGMLAGTAERLRPYREEPAVAAFLPRVV